MNPRRIALTTLATLPLWLSACSQEEKSGAQPSDSRIETPQALDTLAREARGFHAGALMSAHTVYVLFDPQCPHCSHLWEASLPLHTRLKFVWVPVVLLGPKSLPQGAALLQAANPLEAMNAHEKSLLAGQGGTAASSSVPSELEAAIKTNTSLLNRLGADSVPYTVARHAGSGQVVTHGGAMSTQALTAFLGLSQP